MKFGNVKLFEKNIIGTPGNPLLIRWIILRIPTFGIFLHKFCRSDHDRALHDHPWPFITILLKNGYFEQHDQTPNKEKHIEFHCAGSILYRPALWRHRVILYDGDTPSWSLVLVGRRIRKWGFHTPQGWCWWRKYNTDTAICEERVLYEGGKD